MSAEYDALVEEAARLGISPITLAGRLLVSHCESLRNHHGCTCPIDAPAEERCGLFTYRCNGAAEAARAKGESVVAL